MAEEAKNSADKEQKEVPGIPFTGADDPRRWKTGRPLGVLNFSTKFKKFIDKVAEKNKTTPEEIWDQLFAVLYKNAKDGNYNFMKDILDRNFGKAIQPLEHTGDMTVRGTKELSKQLDDILNENE